MTTVASIAEDIRREHRLAREHAETAVEHARRCGELLIEAKAQAAHGAWLPWLAANVPDIAERTAQAYMRLASQCLADPAIAQRVADLSLRSALAVVAEPNRAPAHDMERREPNVAPAQCLPPWSGDDVSWLPTDGQVARWSRSDSQDPDEMHSFFVWESIENSGFFHYLYLYPGQVANDLGGVQGNYRPGLGEAMTMIAKEALGFDPTTVAWDYGDGRESFEHTLKQLFKPKWLAQIEAKRRAAA
jgi:hypothetical protein